MSTFITEKHFMKRVFVALLLFGVISTVAQNNWQRVSSGKDPLYLVENVNDTLYGVVLAGKSLEIRCFEDNFWKRFPPINLRSNESYITLKKLKGIPYLLTDNRLFQYKSGQWKTIASGAFLLMERYLGKLVIYGAFNQFRGETASGLAYWDGSAGGALRNVAGQAASITGWVNDMAVIGNKIYFVGDIANTQTGPIYSNTVMWNDTVWQEPLLPQSAIPEFKQVFAWNGEIYYCTGYTSSFFTGIYKQVGMGLQALGPIAAGAPMTTQAHRKVVVFNNRLYMSAVLRVGLTPGNLPILRRTLLYYDGANWHDSGDSLNPELNPTTGFLVHPIPHLDLVVYNNELYANQLPMVNGQPYVGKIANSNVSASLAVMDLRDTICDAKNSYRYLPTMIQVQSAVDTSYFYSSKLGDVEIPLPDSAQCTVTLKTPIPYYQASSCSDTALYFNTTSNTHQAAYFFVTPPSPVADVGVSLSAQTGWRARHGFFDDYYIVLTNQGTDSLTNLLVELSFPTETYYHTAVPAATASGNGFAQFNVPLLLPGDLYTIRVKLHNTTQLSIGDSISLVVNATLNNDLNVQNNVDTLFQQVVAAYDPNNKLVDREGIKNWGGTLTYQINFQNLGNDKAYRVVIADTLSAFLHPETFRLLAASHAVDVELKNRVLLFTFDDIYLPDSASNPEGSKGFVKFSMAMKTNLRLEDTIANRAHIYFDFQPAVITNRAYTYIREEYRIEDLPIGSQATLRIYPNPSTGVYTAISDVATTYDVYDHLGNILVARGLLEANTETQINLGHLPNGIYYFKAHYGFAEKLVIQR